MAKELGENMSDDELKEMMFEANKTDREGVVYKSDFMSVLQDENPWKKYLFSKLFFGVWNIQIH